MMIPADGRQMTLLEYVVAESRKPIPAELAAVPHYAAVIHYLTNQGESRSAPASLCYPVHDTQGEGGRTHRDTILSPVDRRDLIRKFVSQHLLRLRFGDTTVRVSPDPVQIPQRLFQVPDYQFGNDRVLSVRGTPGAHHVSLDNVGRTR